MIENVKCARRILNFSKFEFDLNLWFRFLNFSFEYRIEFEMPCQNWM